MKVNPWGVDFSRQAGVEMTYIHRDEGDWSRGRPRGKPSTSDYHDEFGPGPEDSYVRRSIQMGHFHTELLAESGICPGMLGNDPGCVEFSTPIMGTWDELYHWWSYGHTLAEMHDLQEEHPHVGGGMGHIHLGVKSNRLISAVTIDIFCRPYVAWAFCDPSAIEYCSPRAYSSFTVPMGVDWDLETDCSEKYTDISPRYKYGMHSKEFIDHDPESERTLEFRFFNSAPTWRDQYLQMAFAQRYVQWVDDNTKLHLPALSLVGCKQIKAAANTLRRYRGSFIDRCTIEYSKHLRQTVRDAYGSDPDRCAREFEQLIAEMGLPWSGYSHLVHRHLQPQFEWGKRGRNLSFFETPLNPDRMQELMKKIPLWG